MDKIGPFQTYENETDAATCAPRLAALRAELKRRGLDGFLVPRADAHQGEYVPKRDERLAWLTAFTGSAGAAAVLADKAAVFVDGRYTLQIRQQTDTRLFEPRDLVEEGPAKWLEHALPKGTKMAYDPWLHTQGAVELLRVAVDKAGGTLIAVDSNPVDAVWEDQPAAPTAKAIIQDMNLAGESAESKRTRIAEDVKGLGADAAVITMPDSICWLLNIRGGDVPHTPFALSFAIQNSDGSTDLFMDERKSSPELVKHLGNAVRLRAPSEFAPALDALKGKTVVADPGTASAAIFDRLINAGAKIKRAADPIQLPKACKNPVEIEGTRKAHVRDGAAVSNFLHWFAREAPKGHLTEIDTAKALEGYRARTGALRDLSFDSISGAGSNGAVVHYRVTQSTNRPVRNNEIFLIDSGGQYPDGTTDITRTVIVGKASDEMKDRFTRVLKGHIALATMRFPEGTPGAALDAFARAALWQAGLDYDHGTGHGVGSYLSVHEGPQNISKRYTVAQPLKPGMICSNEPGYYKNGEYGIRIENLIVVSEAKPVPGGDPQRKFMTFETITLAPIDLELIEPKLLTADEKGWLNAYHARVRETLLPLVDADARDWLKHATRAI
ncbi:MAG: aminopeptidase P family protein [Alphaproteobacteria bacterium]|nr:aminopeptidase P family protein [Alphaproteobacteria bacterium]MBL6936794.1 aminopeptidase P family protein [Alphaproteobacteria bacterium]MBL7097563.1 aminopeptidase P family protein [Alphaproteobacteria bacterium]